MKTISELTRADVLAIVNNLKINPILKSVVISQVSRARDEQLRAILAKVETIIVSLQSGNKSELTAITAEMKTHAAKIGLPGQYVDGLMDLLKTNAPDQIK